MNIQIEVISTNWIVPCSRRNLFFCGSISEGRWGKIHRKNTCATGGPHPLKGMFISKACPRKQTHAFSDLQKLQGLSDSKSQGVTISHSHIYTP